MNYATCGVTNSCYTQLLYGHLLCFQQVFITLTNIMRGNRVSFLRRDVGGLMETEMFYTTCSLRKNFLSEKIPTFSEVFFPK